MANGSNRYTRLSFSNLRDTPLLQLPYQQLDELLSGFEQRKVLADKLSAISPKYIQESEYATNVAKQINQYQQGVRDKLTEIARTGDTRQYMQALDEAQQAFADLYRPGGIAANLEEDYKKYAEFQATQKKRLEEGKISPESYMRTVKDPIKMYDEAKGQKKLDFMGRPDMIKFDDFADKFIKNYKDSDLIRKGNFKVINGRMVYDEEKISGVEAQRVLNDLTQAYKNAATETGQLEDKFSVLNQNNQVTEQFINVQKETAAKTLSLLDSINLKDKQQVEKLQKELQQLGLDTGGLDGKVGPKTKAAIETARKAATETLESIQNSDVSQLTEAAKETFINQYVKELSTPYASAAARQTYDRKFINFGETLQRVAQEESIKKKIQDEEKSVIVPTMPFNKPVPKDVKFYVRNGELKKNTNASADLRDREAEIPQPFPGWSTALGVISFFDRLFTSNDKADLNEPELKNIQEHLIANDPDFANLPADKQMEQIAQEINTQSEESAQGTFTANMNSKFKKNFDAIFTDTSFDKDSDVYNAGLMSNFKFMVRDKDKTKIISGQQLAKKIQDGDYGKNVTVSYKGSVDDYTSPLPYGSTVFSIGGDEIYMEPDIQSTNTQEALLNGVYRSIINAEIGNISHFKYNGNELMSVYKPDKSVEILNASNKESIGSYIPQYDANNNFVGLTKK